VSYRERYALLRWVLGAINVLRVSEIESGEPLASAEADRLSTLIDERTQILESLLGSPRSLTAQRQVAAADRLHVEARAMVPSGVKLTREQRAGLAKVFTDSFSRAMNLSGGNSHGPGKRGGRGRDLPAAAPASPEIPPGAPTHA
jgi:hypothetical protein